MRPMVPQCQSDHVPAWVKALQRLPVAYWMKSKLLALGPSKSLLPLHTHHAISHTPGLCLGSFCCLEFILQSPAQMSPLLKSFSCLNSLLLAAKHSLFHTPVPLSLKTLLSDHRLLGAKVGISVYYCFNIWNSARHLACP